MSFSIFITVLSLNGGLWVCYFRAGAGQAPPSLKKIADNVKCLFAPSPQLSIFLNPISMPGTTSTKTLSMTQVLLCGAIVVTLSMGIRHGFGLWLQPITQSQDWSRATFAFAIALQNLVWGVSGIFAGTKF